MTWDLVWSPDKWSKPIYFKSQEQNRVLLHIENCRPDQDVRNREEIIWIEFWPLLQTYQSSKIRSNQSWLENDKNASPWSNVSDSKPSCMPDLKKCNYGWNKPKNIRVLVTFNVVLTDLLLDTSERYELSVQFQKISNAWMALPHFRLCSKCKLKISPSS